MAVLEKLYVITHDWSGTLYCGLTLKWDYDERAVEVSMPGYVAKALSRFQTPVPTRPQHSPHAYVAPSYGTKVQLTAPIDDSEPLAASEITRLQEIIGVLLFYARAVDSTMLVALGTLSSAQAKGTQATAQAATQLLNYCATHPDATLCYRASGMGLHGHSDGSYLSETAARSRVGGIFFLSDRAPPDGPVSRSGCLSFVRITPSSEPPVNTSLLVPTHVRLSDLRPYALSCKPPINTSPIVPAHQA
jgi:hypothetical protein